jgi:hypothetical protein
VSCVRGLQGAHEDISAEGRAAELISHVDEKRKTSVFL